MVPVNMDSYTDASTPKQKFWRLVICFAICFVSVIAATAAIVLAVANNNGKDKTVVQIIEVPVTNSPTALADILLQAATAVSDERTVNKRGTAQRQAVGWMSTEDQEEETVLLDLEYDLDSGNDVKVTPTVRFVQRYGELEVTDTIEKKLCGGKGRRKTNIGAERVSMVLVVPVPSFFHSLMQTCYQSSLRVVLLVLYYSTGGPTWPNQANWLSPDQHECDWTDGIFCNVDPVSGERVVKGIDLEGAGLRGTLPSELDQLVDLGEYKVMRACHPKRSRACVWETNVVLWILLSCWY